MTNAIEQNGSRVSASLGTGYSGRLFGRTGAVLDEGFVALNVGAYKMGG